MTDLIFESVNRLIHKEEDTEVIYCDRVIDGDRVYAEIQIKTYDGGGKLTVLRPVAMFGCKKAGCSQEEARYSRSIYRS